MIAAVVIILNLFLLESMLSIDNAAVLAIIVKDLPEKQRINALRYGILGAFILRGGSLFLVSFLSHIWWLKMLGGLYLLYLFVKHITKKEEEEDRKTLRNGFWATVVIVELMDLSFSVDNILAAVAMTNNLIYIIIGVFLGIISMRFVAQWFSKLILKFPSLEDSAYVVILLLGIKQFVFQIGEIRETNLIDTIISLGLLLVFFVPVWYKDFFNK